MFSATFRFVVLAFSLALVGCSVAQKDYDHMATADYQKRPQLHQSLINGSEPLSEAAVQKFISKAM